VAVHFKGSGFYSTDYGRSGRKASKDGDSAGGEKAKSDKSDKGSGDKGAGETKKPAADAG
jgi:predicted nucleic acid-binding Zn ribbon protein